jgi:hypothetical protein
LHLSKDASYILFGGSGGVGKALAVFFAEAGAGERTFLPSACYLYQRCHYYDYIYPRYYCDDVLIWIYRSGLHVSFST